MITASTVELIEYSVTPSKERLGTYLISAPWRVYDWFRAQKLISVSEVFETPAEMLASTRYVPRWVGLYHPDKPPVHEMTETETVNVRTAYRYAQNEAFHYARAINDLGADAQIIRDLLAPHRHMKFLASSTEWTEILKSFKREDVTEYELNDVVELIKSIPRPKKPIKPGDWHLPFVKWEERDLENVRMLSVARCYLGTADVGEEAAELIYHRLVFDKVYGVFEHVAQALVSPMWSDHYRGFRHHRQDIDPGFQQIGLSGNYRTPSFVARTKTTRRGCEQTYHVVKEGAEDAFRTKFTTICGRPMVRPVFHRIENVAGGGVCERCRQVLEYVK